MRRSAVLVAVGLAVRRSGAGAVAGSHRQLQEACANQGGYEGDPDPDGTCAAYFGAGYTCDSFAPGGDFAGMCDEACGHGACAGAPSDCVGAWSTCTASCTDKVYIVTAAETNGGRTCPVAHQTRAACSPGEGGCPCEDLFLPDDTYADCASLVAATQDGCDGVYRSSSVSSPVDELCPATCNSCCEDTLVSGEHDCGSLIRANIATCDTNFVRFSTFDGGADAGRCDSTCHYCNDRCMDNSGFTDGAGAACSAYQGQGCDDTSLSGGTPPEELQTNCPYSCGVCSVRSAPRVLSRLRTL
jgi:hypothetical protein